MTPSQLRARVVSERVSWTREMVSSIRALPLECYTTFCSDRRNLAAAESFLRRGLEALLDLGRHILTKGFGEAALEYKEIASGLAQKGVLNQERANLLRELAGYRNRMVHFYQEISDQELFDICTRKLDDIESLLKAIEQWISDHPEMIDHAL